MCIEQLTKRRGEIEVWFKNHPESHPTMPLMRELYHEVTESINYINNNKNGSKNSKTTAV